MKYVLDTNILSELTKPQPNPAVVAQFQAHRADCVTTSVVAYELLYGTALLPSGQRKSQLDAQYSRLFAAKGGITTRPYDLKAAAWQAKADAALRSRGLPRPWRDAQIAAIAASTEAILVTRNTVDFEPYEGLHLEDWFYNH